MKWNSNQISKFLETYQNFPVLWDLKNKDYVNAKLKDTHFQKLCDELESEGLMGEMDGKQLRSKIKTIKDVYRKEIAKLVRSKKSGQGTDNVYIPKLAWFENAAFLREVISTRESQSNLEIKITTSENRDEEILEHGSNDSQLEAYINAACSSSLIPVSPVSPVSENMKAPMPPRKKKKISPSPIEDSLEKFSQIVDKAQLEDSFDHFGRYVASELRQLSQRASIKLQFDMQKLIMEAKLEDLSEKHRAGNQSEHSFSPSIDGNEGNFVTTGAQEESKHNILEEAVAISIIEHDDGSIFIN